METIEYKGKTYKVRYARIREPLCKRCAFDKHGEACCCSKYAKLNRRGVLTRFAYFVPVRRRRFFADLVVGIIAMLLVAFLAYLCNNL